MCNVPLSSVATVEATTGPNLIRRENGKRRIVVTANVRERDLGSFVAEAQDAVAQKVKLPPGYWIGWGGQFEQLVSATTRLSIVVPVALLLVFLLLFMSMGRPPMRCWYSAAYRWRSRAASRRC
jgi:cobalt-zinc-cadmium resistance protein CzcA